MPLTVHEIRPVEEERQTFDRLVQIIWTAFHQPYQPFISAYEPVFGPTAADRQNAIQASADRKWRALMEGSKTAKGVSSWIYVRDTDQGGAGTDEIVGCVNWQLFDSNPYPESQDVKKLPFDLSMWPDGSTGKVFVREMLKKQYLHKTRWMRRPHASCVYMSVLPSHRGKGVGRLLMDWGMRRARDRGLEVFIQGGSAEGRRLYESFGLRVITKIDLDMERTGIGAEEDEKIDADEWERLRHDFGPLRFYVMWKPAGDGVYEEGKTRLPWETS